MREFWFAILFAATGAFGRADTIAISAARTVNVPPDQVQLSITLQSDVGASLDQVVSALNGTGIAAADLSGVSSPASSTGPGSSYLRWSFQLAVSISKLNTVAGTLAQIQQTLPKQNAGWDLSYFIGSSQVSAALQATQVCPYPALVGDAQAQAQKLAAAAGRTLGSILTVTDSSSSVGIPGVRSGDFSAVGIAAAGFADFLLGPSIGRPSIGSACTATVTFDLR
jgi:hypothetical protein